jgi:putative chitinase
MNTSNLSSKLTPAIMAETEAIQSLFGITTKLRMAHFLGQCAHESANFTAIRENLNYSADGLQKIFKKYFPTPELAMQYARQPEKIANRVYANRMGNGDEASGDGFKFRGRGFVQLTGKDNYRQFDSIVSDNIVENPDLVATKYPLTSAAYFFQKNNLWLICDKGDTDAVITELTKRVNGGTHGLTDRIAKFRLYNSLIS